MTTSTTFQRLEAAHATVAQVAGRLALLMETKRGLSRTVLREQAEALRSAADSLEAVIDCRANRLTESRAPTE